MLTPKLGATPDNSILRRRTASVLFGKAPLDPVVAFKQRTAAYCCHSCIAQHASQQGMCVTSRSQMPGHQEAGGEALRLRKVSGMPKHKQTFWFASRASGPLGSKDVHWQRTSAHRLGLELELARLPWSQWIHRYLSGSNLVPSTVCRSS